MPPWGLVYDIKRKCCGHASVPPWGFVYDIKKDVPPDPPCTLMCRRGDWYMILKRRIFALPVYGLRFRMLIKRHGAAVGIGV